MARPEWEIEKREFLKRMDVSESDFVRELHLPDFRAVRRIVPLRFLRSIESLIPLTHEMLFALVSKMRTQGGQHPFRNARLQICRIDPNHVKIGQRFAYRENYQMLLEEVPGLFGKFAIASGLNDLGAYFAFGADEDGLPALACYLPPLVEQHGGDLVVMDGIHRNFLTKQLGATINTILITGVAVPFPCGIRPWSELRVIGLCDKPKDIRERYFDLDQLLFRDLKFLGIDG
ncbi:MAG: hypothetical protein HYT14_00810 [Candidatus Liptonbacteria bacterium]|nr:hypothetical protein [Candidatus Liptonbacteria bacterium]